VAPIDERKADYTLTMAVCAVSVSNSGGRASQGARRQAILQFVVRFRLGAGIL